MQYGSLINTISDGRGSAPFVGMPATILHWTDRSPATVIAVTACTVTVQEDKATRIDKNGMSDAQDYSYERDPEGAIKRFHKTKKGVFKGLLLGHREKYHDYSF